VRRFFDFSKFFLGENSDSQFRKRKKKQAQQQQSDGVQDNARIFIDNVVNF
jgi:hypothetical protein